MRPTLTVLGMLLSFFLTALAAPMPLPMAANPNVARLQMGRRAPAPAPVPREASRSRENVLNNMMRVRGAGKQAMRDRLAEQQRLVRERLAVSVVWAMRAGATRLTAGRGVGAAG